MVRGHRVPALAGFARSGDFGRSDPRLRKLRPGAAVEIELLRVHVPSDFVLNDNYIGPNK